MLRATLLALSLALSALQVSADAFDDALSAYQSGDFDTAAKAFRKLAERGDVVAQYNLGTMYENGKGIPQDYAEAVRWYTRAAEQGNAGAQFNLGILYEYGAGLPQNNIMAHMWYDLASENGAKQGGEWRDERAGLMTAADIAKAQTMARECMDSGYKNCGD
jgi:TPR repeat protein